MKVITSIFFCLITMSFYGQKEEYAVVNNFLETELSKIDADTIFVIEQPLQRIKTLEMYEMALAQRGVLNSSSEKKVWVYPESNLWPLTEDDVAALKQKLSQEKEKEWSATDFKSKKFIILPEVEVRSKDFIVKHIHYNSKVFNLSRPIFSNDNHYALLQFYPSFLIGGGSSHNDGTILLKKEGGKWVQIAVLRFAVYH